MKNRAYLRALCDRYGYDFTAVENTARALLTEQNAEPRTKRDTRALMAHITKDNRITARDNFITFLSAVIGFVVLIALIANADNF